MQTTELVAAAPRVGMLLLAVIVPFAVLALLASPLAFEAVKHSVGF